MKSHFSEEQIKKYHTHKLTGAELLGMDQHIEECPGCSARLVQNSAAETRIASLELQLQSEAEEDHLEYEQLVSYIGRKLDYSDHEIVEAHLQSCSFCKEEEQDLRKFGHVISLRNRKNTFVFRIVGVAAAIALLAFGIRFLQWNKPEKHPVAFMIQDGEYRVAFNKEGRILGSEWNLSQNSQQQLQRGFEGKALQIPDAIGELKGKKGVLLSEDVPNAPVRLSEPLGTVISTDRPTFRWEGPQETSGYTISIYDTGFGLVAQSPVIDQKEWTIESRLERGKTYIWMVSMRQGDRIVKAPVPPAPEARFRVLNSQDYETLQQRIQKFHGAHLFMGVQYLEFGLLDEAEQEWQQLVKQNPNSAKVQSLLHSLEVLRQP